MHLVSLASFLFASCALAGVVSPSERSLEARRSGGYVQSCSSSVFQVLANSDALFRGGCNNDRGLSVPVQIKLSGCLGNSNGRLVANSGGFTASCKNWRLGGGGTSRTSVLYADCKNVNKVYGATQIDLNTVVGNANGRLIC